MESKKGFTVLETLTAAIVMSLIISAVYTVMIQGIKSNETGIKNIDAIQEMAFIIHNIRSDLRTLIEFPSDSTSCIVYDAGSRSLKFMVVNGVNAEGFIIFSQVTYTFDDTHFIKQYYELNNSDKLGNMLTKKLAKKDKIKGFTIEVCDGNGNPVSGDAVTRESNPPKFLKSKIIHASNAKFEVNISLYSTYMKSRENFDKFWLPACKIVPISPTFKAVTSFGDVTVDTTANPHITVTPFGIKVGKNMGVPTPLKKLPDDDEM
jgi:type II secretory pathway pseudopilin PulG